MALVKLGAGIVEINGQVGGDIYRRDIRGQHVQSTPRLLRKESPKQKKRRRAFRKTLNFCSHNPVFIESYEAWWIWCADHPFKNKKGETRYYHPWLACVRINTIRTFNDLEPVSLPPD